MTSNSDSVLSKGRNLDDICSKLKKAPHCVDIIMKPNNDSISNEQRVRFFLNMLSSHDPYQPKKMAISKLNEIFSMWFAENSIPCALANESMTAIIRTLVDKNNIMHRQHLLSLTIRIITVVNKHKSNKWEAFMELVTMCVKSKQPKLLETVCDVYIKFPSLFGKTKPLQILQYYHFFTAYLQTYSDDLDVALFAIDLLRRFLSNNNSYFCIETFTQIIPNLMETVEALIETTGAEYLVDIIRFILKKHPEVFRIHIIETLQRMCKLLSKTQIELHVAKKLHLCINDFVKQFSEPIKGIWKRSIPSLIKNMLESLSLTYPNTPEEWFTQNIKATDLFSYQNKDSMCYYLGSIVVLLGCRVAVQDLFTKCSQLINSSNWKHIASAIDSMSIITRTGKFTKATLHYEECLDRSIPWLSDNNPIIVYTAIRTTAILYSDTIRYKFKITHKGLVSRILVCAVNHWCIYIKLLALHVAAYFTKEFQSKFSKYPVYRIIQLYDDVFDAFFNTENTDLMMFITESICATNRCILVLIKCKFYHQIYNIINNLLKLVRKIYSVPGFSCSVHRVIEYIDTIVASYPTKKTQMGPVVQLIVKFVDNFKKTPNEASECLQIQPCFFELLDILTQFRWECAVKLIPKILSSIIKFLDSFPKLDRRSCERAKGKFTNISGSNSISRPTVGCMHCFTDIRDAGIRYVCTFMTTLIVLYGREFSSNIDIDPCLNIICKIIQNIDVDSTYVKIMDCVSNLLYCSILIGGKFASERLTSTLWNKTLKLEFFRAMKVDSNENVHRLLPIFSNIITLFGHKRSLNEGDIRCIGEIFNNCVFYDIQINVEILQLNKFKKNIKFSHQLNKNNNYSFSFNYILDCIVEIAPLYNEIIIDALIPMCKTLVTVPKTNQWGKFLIFLLGIIDNMLQFLPKRIITKNDIFSSIFHLSVDILCANCDEDVSVNAIITTASLKVMFPTFFQKYLEVLNPNTISKINILIS